MTEKLGSHTIYYASQKSFSYKDYNKINFNEFLALKSPSEALSLYPYYYCDTVITNLGLLRPAKKSMCTLCEKDGAVRIIMMEIDVPKKQLEFRKTSSELVQPKLWPDGDI